MTQLRLRWFFVTVVALGCVLLGANHVWAQATNSGTVIGTITDPSGAVVSGASVTLTGPGLALKTATNGTGQYLIQAVPPGTYSLTVTKSGFATSKTTGAVVTVGTQTTINMKLTVGGSQETVEVQVSGEELQTLNSTVSQTVSGDALAALPSMSHDADTFMTLQPGISPNGSVAGTYNDQNMFMLDGGNNTSDMDGSNAIYNAGFAADPTGVASDSGMLYGPPSGVMPVPQDSVQTFTVNTANQTADFDNSSGSQVELVTPRGTNHWHGGAYEYYLDNGFDANTWDNNQNDVPLTQYHYSRFGAHAGGFILPNKWGGRTYFFGFYEGYRYPQSETVSRVVPSASLLAGTIYAQDSSGTWTPYSMATIDPRGIGMNPDVYQMWNKYEPAGNVHASSQGSTACGTLGGSSTCDGYNEDVFTANMSLPLKSNDMVYRIDHDFSAKWHWFASYRYFKLTQAYSSQYDIGGFFPGDTKGVPDSTASRPYQPSYLVSGLTTNITSNTTNEFHYSFMRNFWQWGTDNAPPQVSGLGGALEPFGETSNVLAPFNVNTQNIRTRFWDGQDHFLSDNVSMLKGNHLIQFGGQYQHDYDYHQRSDNGGGINFTPTYQLGAGGGTYGDGNVDLSDLLGGFPAAGFPASSISNVGPDRALASALGIVSQSQVAYTRSGSDLALNPPLTHAFDQDTIPFYNAYISDTWHMKPSFTLTYGLGYTLEMPPAEKNGKSTVLVDSSDEPIVTADYLKQREVDAEQGQAYNPELGFALVGNVGNGRKYPYNPFYGSFSPRLAFAWNPSFSKNTVVRGGYGRIYGRLNGVDLVLVPLLGVGLMQAVQCTEVMANGTCGGSPTAMNAFRVGVDGTSAPLPAAAPTLPQPAYPGYNLVAGSANEAMDPSFRPNDVDSFDFSIQRQIGQKSLLEVGYIGRLIHHEYQPINLNAVPYMMSVGGQQFQNAYAQMEIYLGCAKSALACGASVPAAASAAYASFINSMAAQPFFEASLAGTGYCSGDVSGTGTPYANCTAAVLDKELTNLTQQAVWSMWSDLDQGNGGVNPGFNFPRTMMNTPILTSSYGSNGQSSSGIAENGSWGWGNYNGGFVSFGTHDWHNLTTQSNLTWSKALGTGSAAQATSEYTVDDPFDIGKMYGEQAFDQRLVFNTYIIANDPWYKGQNGLLGRAAGGWSFAPLFTAGSGGPVTCYPPLAGGTEAQSFGEADGNNYFSNEECVFTSRYNAGHSAHFGVSGSDGIGTSTSATPVNMFTNPAAVFAQVRAPMLGIDTKNPGVGPIMGQGYWNLDGQVRKNFKITESANFEFSFIATNMLNHRVFDSPLLDLGAPSAWGVLNTQQNSPRQMEFGGRVSF